MNLTAKPWFVVALNVTQGALHKVYPLLMYVTICELIASIRILNQQMFRLYYTHQRTENFRTEPRAGIDSEMKGVSRWNLSILYVYLYDFLVHFF